MKKDEKNAVLSELCDSCDPEKEALLAIYANKERGDYYAVGDMDLFRSGIYDILKNGIAGKRAHRERRSLGLYSVLCENYRTRVLTSKTC